MELGDKIITTLKAEGDDTNILPVGSTGRVALVDDEGFIFILFDETEDNRAHSFGPYPYGHEGVIEPGFERFQLGVEVVTEQ